MTIFSKSMYSLYVEPVETPWKKYAFYSLGIVLILAFYQWISSPLVITVSGTASVSVPAEYIVVTFTVSGNGDNPNAALEATNTRVSNIKNRLAEIGVADNDIYESSTAVVPASAVREGGSGFQSTASLGLKTAKTTSLDRIVATLYENGASVVSQPSYSVENTTTKELEAYNMALKDAKSKAGKIALRNWKLFRKIVLIQESQLQNTTTVTSKADASQQVRDDLSPADGLIKINKAVSVSYKLW